jgi:hypothetical protein
MISTVAGSLVGSGFSVGVSVGLGVSESVAVGLGLSVGLPMFGYKTEHPETDAASRRAITAIRRFFINPD